MMMKWGSPGSHRDAVVRDAVLLLAVHCDCEYDGDDDTTRTRRLHQREDERCDDFDGDDELLLVLDTHGDGDEYLKS